MRRSRLHWAACLLCLATALGGCKPRRSGSEVVSADNGPSDDPLWAQYAKDFDDGYDKLDADAKKGRKIWYFATAGNARHHSYVLPQVIGMVPDYWDVF
jgi:hypothetical protein